MAQILIKGENVYRCDVCSRKIRVLADRDGIDVVQRCTITYGCRGKLHRVLDSAEINDTPAFPVELPGVADWYQRKIEYTHTQPIKSTRWVVKHNLSNKPLVYAYTSRQTSASPTNTSVNVPIGAIWYKSESGYDPANPHNPTAAGLYTFNGTQWVTPTDVIPVGLVSSTIFEYLEYTTPSKVVTIDPNTTEVYFNDAKKPPGSPRFSRLCLY